MENDFIAHFFLVTFAVMLAVGVCAAALGLLLALVQSARQCWADGETFIFLFTAGGALCTASLLFGTIAALIAFFPLVIP